MLDNFELAEAPAPASLSTGEVWFRALSSPKVETFKKLILQEDSPARKALYWLFIAGGFGGLLAGLLAAAFNQGVRNPSPAGEISSGAVLGALLGAALFSIGAPLITVINTWLIQLIVRRLGGKTNFTQLLFAFAIYQAPLLLLICILVAIPTIGCLVVPLTGYWLVLSVLAVQAACELDMGKAVLCSLAPFGLGGVFGVCALLLALTSAIEFT